MLRILRDEGSFPHHGTAVQLIEGVLGRACYFAGLFGDVGEICFLFDDEEVVQEVILKVTHYNLLVRVKMSWLTQKVLSLLNK